MYADTDCLVGSTATHAGMHSIVWVACCCFHQLFMKMCTYIMKMYSYFIKHLGTKIWLGEMLQNFSAAFFLKLLLVNAQCMIESCRL